MQIPEHDNIEYTGPDWNPNDPLLTAEAAPHETAGILRIHRNGYAGPRLQELFPRRLSTTLIRELKRGLEQEGEAYRRELPIHDPRVEVTPE